MRRSPGVVLHSSPFTISLSEGANGSLLLASRQEQGAEVLLFAGYVNPKNAPTAYLKNFLPLAQKLRPLQAAAIRLAFSPEDRHLFSEHLLHTHDRREPLQSKAADIAWRYEALVSWGESKAAKILSEYFDVPVRTIHTRLQMARDKGLLDAPGFGNRLGGSPSI